MGNNKNKTTSILMGKIPPQSIELEEAVLGSMLIDKDAITDVLEILNEDVFYKESHQMIFKAIKELHIKNNAVDLLTVSEEMRKNGTIGDIGGDYYLVMLSQKVASSAHTVQHSYKLMEYYIKRELINNSRKIIEYGYDESTDVFTVLDGAYNRLNSIAEITQRKQIRSFKDIKDSVIDKGVAIYQGLIPPGVPTSLKELDEITGGWRNGEFIIIAARPGMGKTALGLQISLDACFKEIPTAFFSLEMSKQQLVARVLSSQFDIPGSHFNKYGLNPADESKTRHTVIDDIPLYIDDTASQSVEQIQIASKRLKAKNNIGLIVVDYLQLMSGREKNQNRENEISKISRGLKLIAKDLDIPVIGLSQLSRAVESRGGAKRPLLSDLRESGAIEQDADIVEFIYRPEYYGIQEWEDHSLCVGQAELITAKNRNGKVGRCRVGWNAQFTSFYNLEGKSVESMDDNDDLAF